MAHWAQDIKSAWQQWAIVSALITIHTFVILLAYVPGCGRGYLGPGGLEGGGKHFNCTGGVTGYMDRQLFGRHIFADKACQMVYQNITHNDPEGILGTLTAILTAYFGVQAGRTLNTFQSVKAKIIRWTVWGILSGLLGGILCSFSVNDGSIPLNKKIWSLSFVLVTAGMAFIIQAFLYLFVDILKKWGGRPLFYPGMNPIVLYVGHELMDHTFPFGWKPVDRTHGTFLFMNLWGTFLCLFQERSFKFSGMINNIFTFVLFREFSLIKLWSNFMIDLIGVLATGCMINIISMVNILNISID